MTTCLTMCQIETRPGIRSWAHDPPAAKAYAEPMPEVEFVRDDAASRYTMSREGELLSALDFRDDGRQITMTRAFTIPAHRGHGYAGELVAHAVADVERRGDRTVIPMCWYVAEWFEANPAHAHLLVTRAATRAD